MRKRISLAISDNNCRVVKSRVPFQDIVSIHPRECTSPDCSLPHLLIILNMVISNTCKAKVDRGRIQVQLWSIGRQLNARRVSRDCATRTRRCRVSQGSLTSLCWCILLHNSVYDVFSTRFEGRKVRVVISLPTLAKTQLTKLPNDRSTTKSDSLNFTARSPQLTTMKQSVCSIEATGIPPMVRMPS